MRDENGQALVLALGFLIFAALVVGAMLTLASASELSTQRLSEQRDTVYAADGATDAAIQAGRIDPSVGAYADTRCHATNPTSVSTPILLTTTMNNTATNVICTWSTPPLNPDRTVTFTTFVVGQGAPVVQATVTYHVHLNGAPLTVEVLSWTYCSHGASC